MHGNPLVIISSYIPHDESNDEQKRQGAWEELTNYIIEIPEAKNVIIMGDINTNIHARKEGEEDHVGGQVFGKGMDFLRAKEQMTPDWKTTNREHLMTLLRTTDMKVMNTYFQKEPKHKVTYQKKDNADGGPTWTPQRYGEIDFCIARRQWANSIIDVTAIPHTNINTDHKAISTKIRQRLKAREELNTETTLKGIKPVKEGKTEEEAIKE